VADLFKVQYGLPRCSPYLPKSLESAPRVLGDPTSAVFEVALLIKYFTSALARKDLGLSDSDGYSAPKLFY
jgi:hypothetical protein